MRRFLILTALVLVFAALPAVAMAEALSAGCADANTNTDYDGSYNGALITDGFNAGEVLTLSAEGGTAVEMELQVDFIVVASASIPGEIAWTFDVPAAFVQWGPLPGGTVTTWDVSCGLDGGDPPPPLPDEDGDGVLDADDACPGTTLGDPPDEPMKNRFYYNTETGTFVDGEGTDSGIDIAATAGCDEDQIIDALELGNGHERFGLTKGALQDWLDSL
jgi:hypothetical protein